MARGSGRNVSPSTEGVAPRMTKMFDGRNMATRPIPVYHDSEDDRASISAAIQQQPKTFAVNMPSQARPVADAVFGTPVAGSAAPKMAPFNPLTGTRSLE